MKTSRCVRSAGLSAGFTLVELAVVIFVLMLFLGMSFLGVTAWKRGSDRAGCVMNIRHVQVAVRGFANSRGLHPGMDAGLANPPINLSGEVIGPGKFVAAPTCPGSGLYTLGGNNVPDIGSLYMTCSLAGSLEHEPKVYDSW